MNESAASTTLKRIALFKVNKVPYLLEFNINWAAATHLTRVWSRWDELGKQAVGQTTVRKGRGNSTVSKSTFCAFFFYLNYCRYTYIYFYNRECDLKKKKFGGGQPSDGGGGGGACPLRPPRDLRPCVWMAPREHHTWAVNHVHRHAVGLFFSLLLLSKCLILVFGNISIQNRDSSIYKKSNCGKTLNSN